MPRLTSRLLGPIVCLGLTACLPSGGNGSGGGGGIIIDGDAGDAGGGGGGEDTGGSGAPTTKTCSDGSVIPIEDPCNCPTSAADCDDGDPCTVETFTSSGECGTCSSSVVNACGAIDGCCPAVCSADNDDDCAGCGNGRVDDGETCDGDCRELVTACFESARTCQTASIDGDPDSCDVACVIEEISACGPEDDCCPDGCTSNQDLDCAGGAGGPIRHGEACAADPDACEDICVDSNLAPELPEDGLCTVVLCQPGDCNNGTECASFEGAEISICLTPCQTDDDCRVDLSCRSAPAGGTSYCL